jgi:hypothetical protein
VPRLASASRNRKPKGLGASRPCAAASSPCSAPASLDLCRVAALQCAGEVRPAPMGMQTPARAWQTRRSSAPTTAANSRRSDRQHYGCGPDRGSSATASRTADARLPYHIAATRWKGFGAGAAQSAVRFVTVAGGTTNGRQPAITRAQSRAFAMSSMPGNSRRSSTAAVAPAEVPGTVALRLTAEQYHPFPLHRRAATQVSRALLNQH